MKYTFKDTGITVELRKVSPLLVLKLRETFPPPKPPTQEVDYGDGHKRIEENPAHPAYQAALDAYSTEINAKMQRLLIKRGVKVDWTPAKRKEVQEIRDFYKAEFGADLEVDDLEVYVSYLCVGTDMDLSEFLDAVMKRSQPTEEAIQEAQARFPSPVQGA